MAHAARPWVLCAQVWGQPLGLTAPLFPACGAGNQGTVTLAQEGSVGCRVQEVGVGVLSCDHPLGHVTPEGACMSIL